MLLIDHGAGYKIVMISLEESDFWREYMHATPFSGVWLMDKHGVSVADQQIEGNLRALAIPKKSEVYRLLVQVNAIAGKVSFLNEYKSQVAHWIEESPRARQNLIKYGCLSQKDPVERDLFFENEALNPETAKEIKGSRIRFIVHRREQLREAGGDISDLSVQEIRSLKNESAIQRLTPEQVQYLEADQIYALKKVEQIKVLRPEMVPYVSDESIRHLSIDQVEQLGVSNKVKYLEGANQINAVNEDQIVLLTAKQRALLNPVQKQAYERRISNPDLLSSNQLCLLDNEEVIERISDGRIGELTGAEIAQISSESLMLRLSELQIAQLIGAQIIQIQSPLIINKLSKKQIRGLSKNELLKIKSNHFFGKLEGKQFKLLSDPQIASMSLESARKFIKFAPERSFKLSPEVILKFSLFELWDLPKETIQMTTTIKKVILFSTLLIETIILKAFQICCYSISLIFRSRFRRIGICNNSLRCRITHTSRLIR